MPQRPEDRDYKKEYKEYQGTPEQIKNRGKRNAARAKMVNAGKARKGDGKEVDHRRHLINGGSNAVGNLRVTSQSVNRGFARDKNNKPITK